MVRLASNKWNPSWRLGWLIGAKRNKNPVLNPRSHRAAPKGHLAAPHGWSYDHTMDLPQILQTNFALNRWKGVAHPNPGPFQIKTFSNSTLLPPGKHLDFLSPGWRSNVVGPRGSEHLRSSGRSESRRSNAPMSLGLREVFFFVKTFY